MTRETDAAHRAISSASRIANQDQAAEDNKSDTPDDYWKVSASNQTPHNQAEDHHSNQVGEEDPASAYRSRWGRVLCNAVGSAPEVLIRSVPCRTIGGHINMIAFSSISGLSTNRRAVRGEATRYSGDTMLRRVRPNEANPASVLH